MDTKVCVHCKKEKPVSEFHRRKEARDGYTSRCRICGRIAQVKRRKEERERLDRLRAPYASRDGVKVD
jgi:hypothetical protein